jgi:hypothetical protein
MNYKIITDETLLREFINWLPDCEDHEQYYLTLFARKKYCPDVKWIKSDKGQLARKTSKKELIFDKIAQMECKLGAYKLDGNPVPQEALACYITPSPRDLWKATVRSIGKLATVLECNGKNSNPHQEVMSEIQKSQSKKKYVVFDIDEKDETVLQECIDTVDGYCDVTETRGGYHVFVHKDKIDLITDKMWYLKLKKFSDVTGDAMTPPWGTYQGGHVPYPIYRMDKSN